MKENGTKVIIWNKIIQKWGRKLSRIGEKIKQVRTNSGISAKQFAKKLGVSESFVNDVETGRKVISASLIDRISKVLGQDINDITMSFEEEVLPQENENINKTKKSNEVNEVWNDAFSSVLKTVPVYRYDMKDVISSRQMPVIGNKVEGFASDKVFFLIIENNDMIGFRIAQGDVAFAHTVSEIQNNSICLIEYDNQRVIRQIKKLDSNKVLLISNEGSVKTHTINLKELNVIAKLEKVEIKL